MQKSTVALLRALWAFHSEKMSVFQVISYPKNCSPIKSLSQISDFNNCRFSAWLFEKATYADLLRLILKVPLLPAFCIILLQPAALTPTLKSTHIRKYQKRRPDISFPILKDWLTNFYVVRCCFVHFIDKWYLLAALTVYLYGIPCPDAFKYSFETSLPVPVLPFSNKPEIPCKILQGSRYENSSFLTSISIIRLR